MKPNHDELNELKESGFNVSENIDIDIDVDNLTKEQILDEELFRTLFALKPEEQIKQNIEIKERAKKVGIKAKDYNDMYKLYKSKYTQSIQPKKIQESMLTNFTVGKVPCVLKCGEWICENDGVYRWVTNNFTSIKVIACPHPIIPIERLINIDTNTEKIKLSFFKDDDWKSVIVERNTIASKNKIIQLANTGIEVNENNAKELITFLADIINLNTQEIPLTKGITHLGWVDNEFVPYTENFKYDGEESFKNIYKNVTTKGNYEIWKNEVKKIRQKSKTMHFMIASSFASPLIELIQINPFIVHIWGKSSTGKTVGLMVAMSVWGNPKVGQLVNNLNSTNVGFERLSSFLRNIPFAGDELQSIKNKFTDFNELIYRLTQGEGKTRGTVNGGVEEKLKWNCAFLTTGEEPITSDFSKEGSKNRVIEIEENQKLIESGNSTVNIITKNYGHAGKEFIEKLPDIETLKQMYNTIVNNIETENVKSEKQINAIAIILLADQLIAKEIFQDKPLKFEDIKAFLSKDIDEADRIYNLIMEWFYQNINKFYYDVQISIGDIWGKYEKIDEEITTVYIIPKPLKDFLSSNNIDFNGVKNKLLNKGYIWRNDNGEYTTPTRVNGILCRCIKIIVKPESSDSQIEQQEVLSWLRE